MSNKNQTAEFYRRKCRRLEKENEELRAAAGQFSTILDSTLVQICKKYGEPVYEHDEDPDNRKLAEGVTHTPGIEGKLVSTGREFEPIGWRIEIPAPALDGCRIRATKRDDKYIIGAVVQLDDPADPGKVQKSAEETSGKVRDIPDRGQNMPEVKGS